MNPRRILLTSGMPQPTIQQTFEFAMRQHQAGRLQEAEQLYRQILAQQPTHFGALHFLGLIAHQVGQNDIAVQLMRQALTVKPNYPEALNNLGSALKAKGQLDEAIATYRQAIALRPGFPEAISNLGIALKDKGQLDDAIAAFRQLIAINPNLPEFHNNLGIALREKGRLDEAIAACRRAIALRPNYADAHNNLGIALKDKGELMPAISAFRQAIALQPNLAEAHGNLGNALKDQGQLDEAIVAYERSIAVQPGYAWGYNNLGVALKIQGRLPGAIAAFRRAISLTPDYAEAHGNLGNALKEQGNLNDAIASYRQAIALRPDYFEAHSNLGSALKDKGQLDEAVAACRQAIALNPNFPQAHGNLGNALKDQGRIDDAIAAYRQAVLLRPGDSDAQSNLVLVLNYLSDDDPVARAEEYRRWNHQHADPLRKFIKPHTNDRSPDRRLRIGYVSPDFRDHVVGRNILPWLGQHDRGQFEITCYAQMLGSDAMTARFQQCADRWRNIALLSDEQVADQIRDDNIDLLVDLALHSAGNRLRVFARKPAPLQVTFAGYPGSTGLTTIDYRLSDPYLDPPGADESLFSEKTVRLPHSFWCYDPLDCQDIPVNPLPALQQGFITFGCLNNFCKINANVLAIWAGVLKQVENSRLLLLSSPGSHCQHALEEFAREGIDPHRIEFVPPQSRRGYLQTYHRIDLGLDTFPYNGHTTSLDTFWMGVPVVTLVGKSPAAPRWLVTAVESRIDRTRRPNSRTIRPRRSGTRARPAETQRTSLNPAPANGAVAAHGCATLRPRYRGGVSPDVARLVRLTNRNKLR